MTLNGIKLKLGSIIMTLHQLHKSLLSSYVKTYVSFQTDITTKYRKANIVQIWSLICMSNSIPFCLNSIKQIWLTYVL